MSRRLGVGLIGAGLAAQAIHLPTLARRPDLFRVECVTDPDRKLAQTVAARAGARATDYEGLLHDSRVDVVAVCSPNRFHAEQVADACRAGIRGVLCEKPLAISADEAASLVDLVTSAKTALVVGAQHQFDPAITEALHHCDALRAEAHTITSGIVLPFNDRYEDWATQVVRRPPAASVSLDDAAERASFITERVMSLAIHDLPIIRLFAPGRTTVEDAHVLAPYGTAIQVDAGGRGVELVSFMRPLWRPEWRLDVWSERQALSIEFTPSYVHGGSARVHLKRGPDEELVFGPSAKDGYDAEWLELHAQVVHHREPRYTPGSLVEDLRYAVGIADQAAAIVREDR